MHSFWISLFVILHGTRLKTINWKVPLSPGGHWSCNSKLHLLIYTVGRSGFQTFVLMLVSMFNSWLKIMACFIIPPAFGES